MGKKKIDTFFLANGNDNKLKHACSGHSIVESILCHNTYCQLLNATVTTIDPLR